MIYVNDVNMIDKELSVKLQDAQMNDKTIKVCYKNDVYYIDSINDLIE